MAIQPLLQRWMQIFDVIEIVGQVAAHVGPFVPLVLDATPVKAGTVGREGRALAVCVLPAPEHLLTFLRRNPAGCVISIKVHEQIARPIKLGMVLEMFHVFDSPAIFRMLA